MSTPTVAPDQLAAALGTPGGPLLLDVRSPAEFESARLPGSVNVPLDQLKRQRAAADELPAPDREVVVVCASGGRARDAAAVLADAGVGGVRVLDGGLSSWREQGGEVEQGRRSWEIERQVRLVAGGIVLTGILASTVAPRAKWVAGGIGGGLTFSALSNTCAMGNALARMPWNRRGSAPTTHLTDALAPGDAR